MAKRALALTSVLTFAALITVGCGGTTSPRQVMNTDTGTVAVFAGDAPFCDLVSFTVTITGATLILQGGGTPVSVISASNPVTVDFAALIDFFSVLNLASVPAGTYSQLTLTLSNPQITFLDTTKNPPEPVTITPSLTTLTVTISIDPPLVVTANGSVALNIDFRLRRSLERDAQGQMTGVVNPVFRAAVRHPLPEIGLGEDGDLKGLVQSVSTTSSDPSFIGSFILQTAMGMRTVHVTHDTVFEGLAGLGALTPQAFVDVQAFVDSHANIVARKVELEEHEDQQKAAYLGKITSVTRDGEGRVTQFNLWVRHVFPIENACVVPKSNVMVNVSSLTVFGIVADEVNRAGLEFNATSLGPGQRVAVHGACQQAGPLPTLQARAIFLRLQTILGNFSTLLAAASDGKTGGFSFVPCGSVFQGQPITALTFAETRFSEVEGLNGLTAGPPLAVRGLLLYPQHPVTVNNVTVTPPTPAFEAKAVHQLEIEP